MGLIDNCFCGILTAFLLTLGGIVTMQSQGMSTTIPQVVTITDENQQEIKNITVNFGAILQSVLNIFASFFKK